METPQNMSLEDEIPIAKFSIYRGSTFPFLVRSELRTQSSHVKSVKKECLKTLSVFFSHQLLLSQKKTAQDGGPSYKLVYNPI